MTYVGIKSADYEKFRLHWSLTEKIHEKNIYLEDEYEYHFVLEFVHGSSFIFDKENLDNDAMKNCSLEILANYLHMEFNKERYGIQMELFPFYSKRDLKELCAIYLLKTEYKV